MTIQIKYPKRRAENLYDDIWIPEESLDIRAEVRAFADKELAPVAHKINTTPESRESFPRQIFEKMAEANLYQIPFSKEFGGRGLKYPILATQIVQEELSYYSNSVAAALYDAPIALLGASLTRFATPHLQDKYLSRVVSGELVASFASSEPQASTDLSVDALLTEATRVDGGFLVNGKKRWITNSCVADFMVFLCKVEGKLTMLLTDMDVDGICVSDPDKKMGNLAQLTSDVTFQDLFVPVENIVGKEGEGLKVALTALTEGRLAVGAMGLGLAQAAFDHAVEFMENRKVFGKELARMQHWQYKFAEHAISLESSRTLCYKAAYSIDVSGRSDNPLCSMAKVQATRLSRELATDAVQVCGALGVVRELGGTGELRPVETIYRDCKFGELYEGTNEVLLSLISRSVFDRSMLD